jgi:hypothetical protein
LKMTIESTRTIAANSGAGPPRGPRGFARAIPLLAWAAFWFNLALFPCCDVVAAAFASHSDGVSQSASAAEPFHHLDGGHSEHPHQGPDSPCGHLLGAGPISSGANELAATQAPVPEWFAIDTSLATVTQAVHQSAILAPREPHPPPLRLYLRTRRLLI